MKNVPVILSERGDPTKTFNNKIIYRIMKKLYARADGFVFQTEDAKKFYENIIKCPYKIIGNPLNSKFIKDDYSHSRNNNIVTAGRLEIQKNHKMLIDSFEQLHKEYPEYRLLIYGMGNLKENLQKYIDDKELNENIILKGKSNRLYDEIYDSKLFVLCSDFEGMPNALMEAMALGLPCISTDCPVGGPKMLINNNENGILIGINNKEQLYEAMKKIIEDNNFANKLSQNAITSMKEYYPEKINREWEEYINYIYNNGVI